MKTSKRIRSCALALTLITFSWMGCTDLEENLVGEITKPIGDYSGDIFDPVPPWQISTYWGLRNVGLASHGGYYSVQELTTDEICLPTKGGEWFESKTYLDLQRHTYDPNNDMIRQTWINIHAVIVYLNERLSYANNYNQVELAHARALRAYHYWQLMDMFGPVKLVTETDRNPPQSTRQEVFAFVEQSLLDALAIDEVSANMDLSNSLLTDGGDPYLLDHYGVLGLLAKLYLNAEVYTGTPMYEKAEIAAAYIIDSGKYYLCGAGCKVTNLGKRNGVPSDPMEWEGYAAVFAANNAGNPEHIFSVNFDENSGRGMNLTQMSLHQSSQLSWSLTAQPWNGYATLEEFYNSYEVEDARKKASFMVGPQFDFSGSAILDYYTKDDNLWLNYTPEITSLEGGTSMEGARPVKFSPKLFGKPDMDNDFPIVRLGEIYLIRAEAKARQSGNWADAETDVNILRDRAGVSPYHGNLTATEFLAERGREMFQETVRRTDLIRFGKYNDTWWEKPASAPFRNLFPIPQSAITADHGLVQNPGY